MVKIAVIVLGMLCLICAADEPSKSESKENSSWREDYTVGPADSFNIELYGKPETRRASVVVQPDGTLTYLQVQNLPVAGLTIEAMRAELQKTLEASYKNIEVIVQPAVLKSKHYFVLGRVASKGAFVLDHPTTIVEAVALAKGFESGALDPTVAGLADLSRAFLVRNNTRAKVNFEKLFLEGDFSQNVELEPDDYLYFPSATSKEIYVLGAVNAPGRIGFLPNGTVMGALSAAGSFSDIAFRERVLVVRGSINNPETIIVDCNDILKGRAKDVVLQPQDIIYVSTRPWRIAEELIDTAVTSFATSMINAWTGRNIIIQTKEALPQTD